MVDFNWILLAEFAVDIVVLAIWTSVMLTLASVMLLIASNSDEHGDAFCVASVIGSGILYVVGLYLLISQINYLIFPA